MEINTAVTIGLMVATHFFVFCIVAYYINTKVLRGEVKSISMFIFFSKPLYSYVVKNKVKINFGYIPLSSYVSFATDDDFELDSPEQKKRKKNTIIFHAIMTVVLSAVLAGASVALGFNFLTILKDLLVNSFELITGKQDYSVFVNFIHSQYELYGRYFYLFCCIIIYFSMMSLFMMFCSLSAYLSLLLSVVLIASYFLVGFKYLELPITFYIDLLLSLIVSGFIYFLLLRFFIK